MSEYKSGTIENDRARVQELLGTALSAVEQEQSAAATNIDPLANILVCIAASFGVSVTPDSLTAGLPLRDGVLAVETLGEAGARAGLEVVHCDTPLRKLKAHHCPAIAIRKDGCALLVTGVPDRHTVTCQTPDSDGEVGDHPIKKISPEINRILIVRPIDCGTASSDDARPLSFWRNIVSGNRAIFTQAIAATVIVNLLGLAMPLFTMNVYDRVLPNNAVTTLVALSVGAALAILFDFIMKTLRGLLIDTSTRQADVRLSNGLMARILGARTNATGKPA